MRQLSKLFLLIPFGFLLFSNFNLDNDLYFQGLYGLVLLGLVGILFEINLILSIIYVLVGFGFYIHRNGFEINYLWGVGGLLLLGKKIKKVEEKVEVVPLVVEKVEKVESKLDDAWARYESRPKIKNNSKKNFVGTLQGKKFR